MSQQHSFATVTVQHLGRTAETDDVSVGAGRSTANQPDDIAVPALGSSDQEGSTADCTGWAKKTDHF